MRRVVVTGLGVVSPIGTGWEAFCKGLSSATPGIERIRAFDAATFPSRIAGEVKDLDVDAVPLPDRLGAALVRDPKSIFGLVAAREALSAAFDAGGPVAAGYSRHRVATMVASGLEIFNLEDLMVHVHDTVIDGAGLQQTMATNPPLSTLQIPAHLGALCIAREAGSRGPFTVNVSACAAGTQAIGEAFLAVRDGVVDAVVTGGYDSMVNPLGVGGFCMLEALSTSNELGSAASRPFDARRDGFVLGEGAAMFVLEERTAARRRGAEILAELRGFGSVLDAYRVSDPAPGSAGAIAAMTRALADAGLEPGQIEYINAHGTGTRMNDPAETAAIRAVFGPAADTIPVSSTKSQIGHLIGAAGAVELAASIFTLRKGVVPATINLTDPDPECDLDYVPGTPRRVPGGVSTVMSSSFGFGGQNAVLVVGGA